MILIKNTLEITIVQQGRRVTFHYFFRTAKVNRGKFVSQNSHPVGSYLLESILG